MAELFFSKKITLLISAIKAQFGWVVLVSNLILPGVNRMQWLIGVSKCENISPFLEKLYIDDKSSVQCFPQSNPLWSTDFASAQQIKPGDNKIFTFQNHDHVVSLDEFENMANRR